jgi:hypothetical protein
MRAKTLLASPLALPAVLAAIFAALAVGLGLEQAAESRRAALLQARTAYLAALATTRTQLAGLAREVVADGVLGQNITWKLEHSVQAALAAKLQKGALDHLILVDPHCTELAAATVGKPESPDCPLGDERFARQGGFFWTEGLSHPALGLALRLTSEATTPLYALAFVNLDADWLRLWPELLAAVRAGDLSIGGSPKAVIAAEGWLAPERFAAALGSDSTIDRWLIGGGLAPHATGGLIFPCLLLALACATLTGLRERRDASLIDAAAGSFRDWCASAGRTTARSYNVPVAPTTSRICGVLAEARAEVEQTLAAKAEQIRALASQKAALSTDLAQRDEALLGHRERLAELAELDSLAVQLERTTGSYLERIRTLHSDADDLADTLGDALASRSRALRGLLTEWQRGVAARGARKFLRGLSETAAATPDRTELDEQLDRLASLSGDVCDIALATAQGARRIVDATTYAERIAAFWHGLALRTGHDAAVASLTAPLADAQALLQLEPAYARIAFDDRTIQSDAAPTPLPSLPHGAWATALYHLHAGLADAVPAELPVVITARLRSDHGRGLLVLQLTAADAAVAPLLPQRVAARPRHVDLARAILAPFDVGVATLPALDGIFPIAVTWALPSAVANARAGAESIAPARESVAARQRAPANASAERSAEA